VSWAEQVWPDLSAGEPADAGTGGATLLVPVGSVEQHGPHLPLDTDTRVAVAVAQGATARVHAADGARTVWTAPAVAYGASGEHAGFAGTLSIGQAALELVLVELARSAGPEVGRIVFVNGHGGNLETLDRAVARLVAEGRQVSSWSPRLGGDAHAGRTETSLLLALAPHLVRAERAEAGERRPLRELLGDLRRGGLRAVTANGVLGDPAGASAEEGERLFAAMVTDLVDHLLGGPVG
jgi:mycofactocin system creatininase family protein